MAAASVRRVREVTLLGPRGLRFGTTVPETRRERRRGLLGCPSLARDAAMLFERARSVHTVGMRFEIAAVLLDAELGVLEVVRLRPGRILLPRRGARHVLECAADVRLGVGDLLSLSQAGQPPRPAAPVTTQDPASSSKARLTPSAASSESADA